MPPTSFLGTLDIKMGESVSKKKSCRVSPAEGVGVVAPVVPASVDNDQVGVELGHFGVDRLRLEAANEQVLRRAGPDAFADAVGSADDAARGIGRGSGGQLARCPQPGVTLRILAIEHQQDLDKENGSMITKVIRLVSCVSSSFRMDHVTSFSRRRQSDVEKSLCRWIAFRKK